MLTVKIREITGEESIFEANEVRAKIWTAPGYHEYFDVKIVMPLGRYRKHAKRSGSVTVFSQRGEILQHYEKGVGEGVTFPLSRAA